MVTAVAFGCLCIALAIQWQNVWKGTLAMERNFYGVLRLYKNGKRETEGHQLVLANGSVRHGSQFTAADRRDWGTTYYSPVSGAGIALKSLASDRSLKVGLIGLGVGTLATYGREGDLYRFYEINPAVEKMARDYFTFLSTSKAKVSVVLGDARLSLEREASQELDLLVVDAFTSDSIPVHLLTKEAFALYLRRVRPSGLIGINIANYHLDLEPVIARAAEYFHLHSTLVSNRSDSEKGISPCKWILLAREKERLDVKEIAEAGRELKSREGLQIWTDDFSNLFSILK